MYHYINMEDNNNNIEINWDFIYNKNNILIDANYIQNILKQVGINENIRDLKIWQTAFTHNSYSKKWKKNRKYTGYENIKEMTKKSDDTCDDQSICVNIQEDSNERLEWLGDSILDSVVTNYICKRFPNSDEGFMSKLLTKLVRTQSLSKISKFYNFNKYILLSKNLDISLNSRNNDKINEDIFEAFVGALFTDFESISYGYAIDLCSKFIIKSFENHIDFVDAINIDDNFKDQLMRLYHKMYKGTNKSPILPIYEVESNNEDNKTFTIIIKDPKINKIVGRGTAKKKQHAEQNAAEMALKFYKK